ncbi:hypothetical protein AB0H73_01775 [Streptomyces olivoreticuli]
MFPPRGVLVSGDLRHPRIVGRLRILLHMAGGIMAGAQGVTGDILVSADLGSPCSARRRRPLHDSPAP